MRIVGVDVGEDGENYLTVLCKWELKDCIRCDSNVHCCERVWRHYAEQAAAQLGGTITEGPDLDVDILRVVISGVPASAVLPPRVEFVEGDEDGEETA